MKLTDPQYHAALNDKQKWSQGRAGVAFINLQNDRRQPPPHFEDIPLSLVTFYTI